MTPSRHRVRPAVALIAAALFASAAGAQDTADLKGPLGRRPVRVWPPAEGDREGIPAPRDLTLGDWSYTAEPADPRDGVPWRLIATPAPENKIDWRTGRLAGLSPDHSHEFLGDRIRQLADVPGIPIITLPDILWQQRMAADLQDVVGIHFHEFWSDDYARILFTLHKVPADGPDGRPPDNYPGRSGVRIEATLLTPVQFAIDQAVVIRQDPQDKTKADSRARHEVGHAEVSVEVLLEALRGPQDYNLSYCTGRRSELHYYWTRRRVGRRWDGYTAPSGGKLNSLRTAVVLVPPTRWSLLMPIPPERVTQKHIDDFNQAITRLGERFVQADQAAQTAYHAQHGSYE